MSTALDPLVEAIADAVMRRIEARLPAVEQNRKLLSVKDAGDYLGRTGASVRGMIASGEIPAPVVKRFSGRVFLVKRELDAWIDAQ